MWHCCENTHVPLTMCRNLVYDKVSISSVKKSLAKKCFMPKSSCLLPYLYIFLSVTVFVSVSFIYFYMDPISLLVFSPVFWCYIYSLYFHWLLSLVITIILTFQMHILLYIFYLSINYIMLFLWSFYLR